MRMKYLFHYFFIFFINNLLIQSELLDFETELTKFVENSELYIKELVSKYYPLRSHLTEDGKLSFKELAKKYGFDCEEHEITTGDGYMLTLFNIPGKGRPVLLMHGILDSSDTFIIRGNISLAITLANSGYNVWAGNLRGTKYSIHHTKLDANVNKEYWNFNLHEYGYYDYPAFIDYILNKTEEQSLTVIGHSQGTASFFVMCSLRPEYSDKIKLFIALAPIALLHNIKGRLKLLAKVAPIIKPIVDLKGFVSVYKFNSTIQKIMAIRCTQEIGSYEQCVEGSLFPTTGFDAEQLEPEFIHVIYGHNPDGTSVKTLYQYVQIINRKKFSEYDHGEIQNMAVYGSMSPPDYNLKNVKAKVALFVGANDYISTTEDTALLREQLPNVIEYRVIPEKMNHLDFIWGNLMPKKLYPHIFNLLEKYP